MSLKGKVAVIIGGEGALGRAVSDKFLSNGVRVVIGWNSTEEWELAQGALSKYGDQVIGVQIDATDESQVESLMNKAKDSFGAIDILLPMVGFFHAGQLISETSVDIWDRLMALNLKTAFLSAKHALKFMRDSQQGRIVVFPARLAIDPQPRFGAYAVSKAGLITLIQVLREELIGTGITVNAVMPSVLDTPKTRHMPNPEPDKWVKPAEVAELLYNICADGSSAVSGSIFKAFGKL